MSAHKVGPWVPRPQLMGTGGLSSWIVERVNTFELGGVERFGDRTSVWPTEEEALAAIARATSDTGSTP